jgi:hypothetical protein
MADKPVESHDLGKGSLQMAFQMGHQIQLMASGLAKSQDPG